jgi:hypothetical protein
LPRVIITTTIIITIITLPRRSKPVYSKALQKCAARFRAGAQLPGL